MKSTQNWLDATIVGTRNVTPTVREFQISAAHDLLANWQAGAHLQMQVLVNGQPQIRSYSLVGLPDGTCFRIAVKRMDGGRGGSRAMWQLAAGDRLQISEPQNHFQLDLSAPHYLLIAGGIGITPLVMMAQQLARHAKRSGEIGRAHV